MCIRDRLVEVPARTRHHDEAQAELRSCDRVVQESGSDGGGDLIKHLAVTGGPKITAVLQNHHRSNRHEKKDDESGCEPPRAVRHVVLQHFLPRCEPRPDGEPEIREPNMFFHTVEHLSPKFYIHRIRKQRQVLMSHPHGVRETMGV